MWGTVIFNFRNAGVLNGSSGLYIIIGGDSDETINGNAGNDIVFGGTGNDTINGGSGNEHISYGYQHEICR
ncbi:MAG: hypothetical protein K2M73_04425 [Lachnospiraceae bacterium]|nr:hypothetical protein [Lachnospiraceae bacterium]MDE6698217.1 hypothetical protein [Lachnospiraceae bacterium]